MENESQEKIEYVNEEQDGSTSPPQGTAEQKVEKLRKFLRHCKKTRAEYLEGWQRARADFLNYIKQNERDKDEFRIRAADDVLLKMLPVLGSFTLANKSVPEQYKNEPWVMGMIQIYEQLNGILKEQGVEEIKGERGDQFNPAYQEIVGEVTQDGESGTIAEVCEMGYLLHGKVVKAARVKVVK